MAMESLSHACFARAQALEEKLIDRGQRLMRRTVKFKAKKPHQRVSMRPFHS
jgi:hypothetical protein